MNPIENACVSRLRDQLADAFLICSNEILIPFIRKIMKIPTFETKNSYCSW